MSITNYFGKPRTKYLPYKSPYTFDHLPNAYPDVVEMSLYNRTYPDYIKNVQGRLEKNSGYRLSYFPKTATQYDSGTHSILYSDIEHNDTCRSIPRHDIVGSETYKLQDITYMFNETVKTCMLWINSSFWSLNKVIPGINIFQILILKIADVDKHVEHLEKMVASLCEDNLSLNNRIKALEQRYERQSHIPLAEPITEPLAQHITVAEAILKY